ncbi:MAG: aldo/keto reductase [Negativicutes bacterium]|nr:aldo/keto reductase [Negativicutes bacterium]
MNYSILGYTGMRVSRLCFGALTIGPLQANLPLQDGVRVIAAAFEAGVNFIDTAELYKTYPYLREVLKKIPSHELIIASKSYAYTYDGMKQSVESACREIGRDYIDIFMLHEQESRHTLKGHAEALAYLADAKKQGLIRAAGVSTHTVEVTLAAARMNEIDVIHPILNMAGIGIVDGSREDMLAAIRLAYAQGKGIYTMKALGGGHLSRVSGEALAWILAQPEIHSVAVGMQHLDEVRVNSRLFSGYPVAAGLMSAVQEREKRLLVEEWCQGCGICAEKCPAQAIRIVNQRAVVSGKCMLCGYCGAHCPEFCLKMI